MRTCEHCKKEVQVGHYMYPESLSSFYLCVECFNKFYTEDMAEFMYMNELQYYTEWDGETNGS